jgi:hypothetical protein
MLVLPAVTFKDCSGRPGFDQAEYQFYCLPCRETSAYGGEHPLKKREISEVVINVAAIVLLLIAAVLSANPEAKHFPGTSLNSIAVIVIPIRESRSWNVSGKTLAQAP